MRPTEESFSQNFSSPKCEVPDEFDTFASYVNDFEGIVPLEQPERNTYVDSVIRMQTMIKEEDSEEEGGSPAAENRGRHKKRDSTAEFSV